MFNVRDIIPRDRRGERLPATYRDADPFMTLQREVNRLFDDMFSGFDMPFGGMPSARARGWSSAWPNIEVAETDKELRVTAEVPGLKEKDVEVLLEDGVLTIRGERKSETEDKERQFSERYYGTFERRIALGPDVQEDKVAADFKDGVLTVTLPKSAQIESKAKRIAINSK
jgi:HSP20 family protein